MKLNEALLTEAARFGNREMQQTLQQINRFRFGVEYEFNVDDEINGAPLTNYIDSLEDDPDKIKFMDEVFPSIESLANHYSLLARDSSELLIELPSIVRQMNSAIRSGASEEEIDMFLDLYENKMRKAFSSFVKITGSTFSLRDKIPLDNFENIGFFKKAKDRTVLNLLKRLQSSTVTKGSNPIAKEAYLADMADFFKLLNEHLKKEVKLDITKSPKILRVEIEDIVMKWYMNRNEAPTNRNKTNKVEFVRDTLPLAPNQVEKVEADITVYKGVEVVTPPQTFDDMLKTMNIMFNYIEDVGYTDDSTGLHLNISTNGQFEDINPIKVMTLISGNYVDARWLPRANYTKDNAAYLANPARNGETPIHQLAKMYASKGPESFIKMFEAYSKNIGREEKFVRFNIQSLLPDSAKYEKGKSRIEYRAIGGVGYHKRKSDILKDVLHICYLVLAGLDPKFLRNDYLSAIIRTLDKWVPKATNNEYTNFLDLISLYRNRRNIP